MKSISNSDFKVIAQLIRDLYEDNFHEISYEDWKGHEYQTTTNNVENIRNRVSEAYDALSNIEETT